MQVYVVEIMIANITSPIKYNFQLTERYFGQLIN